MTWLPKSLPMLRRQLIVEANTHAYSYERHSSRRVAISRFTENLRSTELIWVRTFLVNEALAISGGLVDGWTFDQLLPCANALLAFEVPLPNAPLATSPTGKTVGISIDAMSWFDCGDAIDVYFYTRSTMAIDKPFESALYPLACLAVPKRLAFSDASIERLCNESGLQHEVISYFQSAIAALASTLVIARDREHAAEDVIDGYDEPTSGANSDHVQVGSAKVKRIGLRGFESGLIGEESARPPGEPIDTWYRSIVRGHFRAQPFGPGRALVKVIYIAAHLRGPDGAPIRGGDSIRVWRRGRFKVKESLRHVRA